MAGTREDLSVYKMYTYEVPVRLEFLNTPTMDNYTYEVQLPLPGTVTPTIYVYRQLCGTAKHSRRLHIRGTATPTRCIDTYKLHR